MQEKIVLVSLIKGKTEKYHQKLVREVGPKFGERYMIENPLPSHITLKSPFEIVNIKEFEKFLKKFVENQNSSIINIGGFGSFSKFVTFLKIKNSEGLLKIQKSLILNLKKIRIKPEKFDTNFKPHMTISYGNTPESFSKIWNYLGKLNKPMFKLRINNLTILKKSRKYWRIYKEFKLK